MTSCFPINVKYLRKLHKMTQTEFGRLFGKTYGTVSMWEAGTREPTVEDVFSISQYFNIPMTDLYSVDLQTNTLYDVMTANELEMFRLFKQLTEEQQNSIINIVQSMVKG